MTPEEERLWELAQTVAGEAADQNTFAGGAAQYAKDRNFKMFNETIDRAIEVAESLPHKLRDLKKFVATHPELDKGGF
jgi:hypothetical protein